MIIKKRIVISVVLLSIFIFPQTLIGEEQKDVLVLLDTSSSVMPIYDDLINYVIGETLREHVNNGDTFHLLSFNSKPEIEVSEKIQTQEDITDILERLLLLQPIGRYTDLILALKYLYQYTIDLPIDREKSIVILTDGIHDPPPGSLFPSDDPKLEQEVKDITEELKRRGWDLRLIKLPSDEGNRATKSVNGNRENAEDSKAAESGDHEVESGNSELAKESEGKSAEDKEGTTKDSLLDDISEELDVPIVEYEDGKGEELSRKTFRMASVTFPDFMGTVGYSFSMPLTFKNTTEEEIHLRLRKIDFEEKNILKEPVSFLLSRESEKRIDCSISLPASLEPGRHDLKVSLLFAGKEKAAPKEGVISLELKKSAADRAGNTLRKFIPLVLIVIVIAAIIGIVFFLKATVFDTSWASSVGEKSLYTMDYSSMDAGKGMPIELFVANQNRNIGLRNVSLMKKGDVKTIGGSGSDFLIFLMPTPRNIGKITYTGENFIFEPIMKEFLIYPKDKLTDCLNKDLICLSERGKKIYFKIQQYISKRERINRIIHLTDHAGLPEEQ